MHFLASVTRRISLALDEVTGGAGQRYLEKIVNIPIHLPPLSNRDVLKLLSVVLDSYSGRNSEYDWDAESNERFAEFIMQASKLFRTVRHIERFSNMLVCMEGLIKSEIDYADHLFLGSFECGVGSYVSNLEQI